MPLQGTSVNDQPVELQAIHLYPIKSCAGVTPVEALLIETGFELDHAWMLVDAQGDFVTQRQLPRMAMVKPTLKTSEMILRAPGMLALHINVEAVEKPVSVTIWKDTVRAYDMGDLAAQWFSDFLLQPVRMVRFDPDQKRLSNPRWTPGHDAENAFQDGFPLLVVSSASLAEVNRRLALAGHAAVTMARFRPNLVLDGLDAHGEDHLDEIEFDAPEGRVRLKLVKPCKRCPIPDVDPASGQTGHAIADVLAGYRVDRQLGGVTLGMNAIVLEGIDRSLRIGMVGRASIAFD
jgi:uncharacterized protein YcbX